MRVLSLCPAATELACSLGASHLLVGRTDECDFPDAARSVPSIGKAADATPESISIFEPDIVFVGPGQHIAVPASAKWSVVRVEPETLDDVYSLFAGVGGVLGKQVEADMLTHDLRSSIARLHDACARFHPTRVYCEIVGGKHLPTYARELVAIAGGDAYAGNGQIEPLLSFNPQVIIALVPCADEHYVELVMSRDGWSALQAVKTERLFVLDDSLFRPTPRLAQGAKLLAKVLHGVSLN